MRKKENVPSSKVIRRKVRLLIAFDGKAWYVRRIRSITHDLENNCKIYVCDKPIANDLPSLKEAVKAVERTGV